MCSFLNTFPLNAVKRFWSIQTVKEHSKEKLYMLLDGLLHPSAEGLNTSTCMLLCCSGAQLCCFVLEMPGKGNVALFLQKDHCNFCTTAFSQFSWVWAGQRGSLGAAYRALSGFFIWGCTMERCFYKLHVIAGGMEMVHLKTWPSFLIFRWVSKPWQPPLWGSKGHHSNFFQNSTFPGCWTAGPCSASKPGRHLSPYWVQRDMTPAVPFS